MEGEYVIIIGAPLRSQEIVGPFDSFDKATIYIEETYGIKTNYPWIVEIVSPEVYGKRMRAELQRELHMEKLI